jgi:hypothetical protein
LLNRLTPNDHFSGRTALLTSKRCILYIYSTNIGTEYFKNAIFSPFFPLQNAVCFIILTYLIPVLFTFYIQGVLKLKKNNSGAKKLIVHVYLPPRLGSCIIHILYTGVLKLKKNNSGAKKLIVHVYLPPRLSSCIFHILYTGCDKIKEK